MMVSEVTQEVDDMAHVRWSKREEKKPVIIDRRGPPRKADVDVSRINRALAVSSDDNREEMTWPEVRVASGLDNSAIKRLFKSGGFPPPIDQRKGPWATWRAIDIRDWLEENGRPTKISEKAA